MAKAPVCDEAALPPASECPDLIAAILQPFFINDEACFNNLKGFRMLSKYNNLTFGLLLSKVLSMCSKISSADICEAFPIE